MSERGKGKAIQRVEWMFENAQVVV